MLPLPVPMSGRIQRCGKCLKLRQLCAKKYRVRMKNFSEGNNVAEWNREKGRELKRGNVMTPARPDTRGPIVHSTDLSPFLTNFL